MAHEFGLNFGEIDCADDGAGEQIGSQLVRARFVADEGEDGGSVEDDPIRNVHPNCSRHLFAPGGFTALGEQFMDQRGARLQVLAGALLRALDAPLLGGDAEFVVFNAEHDFVADLDAEGFAKGRGDYDAAVFVNAGSKFFRHGSLRVE